VSAEYFQSNPKVRCRFRGCCIHVNRYIRRTILRPPLTNIF
jgi:hypothetical protein